MFEFESVQEQVLVLDAIYNKFEPLRAELDSNKGGRVSEFAVCLARAERDVEVIQNEVSHFLDLSH